MKAAPNALNAHQVNLVTHASLIAKADVKVIFAILIQVYVHLVAVKMDFTLTSQMGCVISVEVIVVAAVVILYVARVHQLFTGAHIVSTVVTIVRSGAIKTMDVLHVNLDTINDMKLTKGDLFVLAVQCVVYLVLLTLTVVLANTDIMLTITAVSLVILIVKRVSRLCVILLLGHVLTDVNQDLLEYDVTGFVT